MFMAFDTERESEREILSLLCSMVDCEYSPAEDICFFFLISTSSFNCVGETSWCVAGIDIESAKSNDSNQINRI